MNSSYLNYTYHQLVVLLAKSSCKYEVPSATTIKQR